MSNDDFELFLSEMDELTEKGEVKKLDLEDKAVLKENAKNLKLKSESELNRQLASGEITKEQNLLSVKPWELGPFDSISYKNDGVQLGVFKKMKQGKYPIESSLDLHRMTVKEAAKAVETFVLEAVKRNLRMVLISHGKGERSPEPAKLKKHLAAWLEFMPDVIACHSSQQRDGGLGSVYVMLKKSESKKKENKIRFN